MAAADLPELKLMVEFINFLADREAGKLSLGGKDSPMYAARVLAERPVVVEAVGQEFQLTHPALGTERLDTGKFGDAVLMSAGKGAKWTGEEWASVEEAVNAVAKVFREDPRNTPEVEAVSVALAEAREVVGLTRLASRLGLPKAEWLQLAARVAVTLNGPVAADAAKVDMPKVITDLRYAGVPTEWELAAGRAKSMSDALPPAARLFDVNRLTPDQLKYFAKNVQQKLESRLGAPVILMKEATNTARTRAAGLAFGDRVAITADESLVAVLYRPGQTTGTAI